MNILFLSHMADAAPLAHAAVSEGNNVASWTLIPESSGMMPGPCEFWRGRANWADLIIVDGSHRRFMAAPIFHKPLLGIKIEDDGNLEKDMFGRFSVPTFPNKFPTGSLLMIVGSGWIGPPMNTEGKTNRSTRKAWDSIGYPVAESLQKSGYRGPFIVHYVKFHRRYFAVKFDYSPGWQYIPDIFGKNEVNIADGLSCMLNGTAIKFKKV